ncbi:hypothetical protein PIB30_088002 [Stylosanthes scabra]|uniref:Uncharacterized protein n=1 Tax=Stylosanthes scabra TaxID=79078 RepID=A0ABU6YSL4_9FABA|nr:hypothetical protein [Stylosanthes scabra]
MPAFVSHQSEKKVVAAPKSAIKARKLFDEANKSAVRTKKGISLNGEDHQNASNFSEVVVLVREGQSINKENNSSMAYEDGSTPISSQLRDLFNRLKLLYSSTPLFVQILEKECSSLDSMSVDIMEPKPPVVDQIISTNDRRDIMNPKSPWEIFSVHFSGVNICSIYSIAN